MEKTRISLIQMEIIFGKKEANLTKAESLIDKAISQSSHEIPHILCLPELFTTGYDLSNAMEHAEKIPEGKTTNFLQQKAKENSITIITSFIEKQEKNYYNTAVIINEKGKLLGKYRKIHLFPLNPMNEIRIFTPGDLQRSNLIFKLKYINLGVMICFDLRFPEISRRITLNGADLLIYLAEFPEPRSNIWLRLLQARAIENQLFVCGVNRIGKDPKLTFFGKSVAFNPVGEILLEGTDKEEVLSAVLEPSILLETRSFLKCLKYRKPGCY